MRTEVDQIRITFVPATEDDFEDLFALRMAAMHDSLERIGRLDAIRSRERFRTTYSPESTRKILVDQACAGFVCVRTIDDGLKLDHLYVHPNYQGSGIGTLALQTVIAEADSQSLAVRLCALRDSDSNKFYQRHGFVQVDELEWDIYYERAPETP